MKTLLTTLVVGQNRIDQALQLVKSFKEHTDFDIVIYHDVDTQVDHDFTVEIGSFTDAPFKYQSVFNYNLKGIVVNHAYNTYSEYDRIIFADCDVQITKPSVALDECNDADVYAAYGQFSDAHLNSGSGKKLKQMLKLLDLEHLTDIKYMTEVMLIFMRNTTTTQFLDDWSDLCNFATEHKIIPCFECVELGIAATLTLDLSFGNLNNSPLGKEGCLITEHREKMIPVFRK